MLHQSFLYGTSPSFIHSFSHFFLHVIWNQGNGFYALIYNLILVYKCCFGHWRLFNLVATSLWINLHLCDLVFLSFFSFWPGSPSIFVRIVISTQVYNFHYLLLNCSVLYLYFWCSVGSLGNSVSSNEHHACFPGSSLTSLLIGVWSTVSLPSIYPPPWPHLHVVSI